jgi:hypothetical protein
MKLISKLLIFTSFLFLISCNDDDSSGGGSGPSSTPTGSISADLGVASATSYDETEGWSLPNVVAVINLGQISITAINQTTGEIFVILLPDNGVGIYNNNTENAGEGIATYQPVGESVAWTSIPGPPNSAPTFFVNITAIDTVAKTLDGEFIVRCNSTLNTSNYAIFQNGSFTEVPYSTDLDGGSGGAFGDGDVTATIDGNSWEATDVIASYQGFVDILNITASDDNDASIALNMPVTAEAGDVFDLSTFSQSYSAQYLQSTTSFFSAQSGNITITSHNTSTNEIEGTFEFDAGIFGQPTAHSITNGAFSVTYTE